MNGSISPLRTFVSSWSVTIDYWQATDSSGHGQRVTLPTYNWNSGSGNGSADPLAAVDPEEIGRNVPVAVGIAAGDGFLKCFAKDPEITRASSESAGA